MKIKRGFELRDVCGESVVVAHGIENIDFSKIISLNETAAYLWKAMLNREFTEEDMAAALTKAYEVEADTALADAQKLAARWQEIGLLE